MSAQHTGPSGRSVHVNGVRLEYDERGEGAPILCIHGAGTSAELWADAVEKLARLGRAIAYDRRGYGRSERPEPLDRMSVAQHADDAAALLDALEAIPAAVIARSYGGEVPPISPSATPSASALWSCSRRPRSSSSPQRRSGRVACAIDSARSRRKPASMPSARR